MKNQDNVVNIDISKAKELIDALRDAHTPKNFKKIMRSSIIRTGKHVKSIVAKDVTKDYHVTQRQVKQHIGGVHVDEGIGTLGVGCSIPIDGKRLSIGGTFSARGGRRGWMGICKGKRYKVRAKIVKSDTSILPEIMEHQGGQPPFINRSAPKLRGLAFTRVSDERDAKIVRVVGISVPQMPMNRSKEDVQEDTVQYLMKRLEHEHARVIKGLGH